MIDFHVHLDLYPRPHATALECIARNLYVLSVTTTPSAWAGTATLTKGAQKMRTALGLHPQIAHERKAELGLFEELLPQVRYVGEIGLDGGRSTDDTGQINRGCSPGSFSCVKGLEDGL